MKEVIDTRGNKVLFLVNKPLIYTGRNGVVLIQKDLTRTEKKLLSRRLNCLPSRFDEIGKQSSLSRFKN